MHAQHWPGLTSIPALPARPQRAAYKFKPNGCDQGALCDTLLSLLLTKSKHNMSAASITTLLQSFQEWPQFPDSFKENLPTSFQVC